MRHGLVHEIHTGGKADEGTQESIHESTTHSTTLQRRDGKL